MVLFKLNYRTSKELKLWSTSLVNRNLILKPSAPAEGIWGHTGHPRMTEYSRKYPLLLWELSIAPPPESMNNGASVSEAWFQSSLQLLFDGQGRLEDCRSQAHSWALCNAAPTSTPTYSESKWSSWPTSTKVFVFSPNAKEAITANFYNLRVSIGNLLCSENNFLSIFNTEGHITNSVFSYS